MESVCFWSWKAHTVVVSYRALADISVYMSRLQSVLARTDLLLGDAGGVL